MTESNLVELRIEGQTAILTLNRPGQLNALNRQLLSELGANIAMLSGRRDLRTIILRGEGRAFAAGADIAEMESMTPAQAEQFARLGQRIFTAFENLPQPTIALVHGFALGGGMELAMACDVRIAAQGAQFGQPEVALGVLPGFGGSQRLPRMIGQGRALYLLLTGDRIDAETARSYGLVQDVVPEDALLEAGLSLAKKIEKLGPLALQYVKRAVYEGAELDFNKGQAFEANLFGLAFGTQDQKEGMKAFLAKRSAEFRGE